MLVSMAIDTTSHIRARTPRAVMHEKRRLALVPLAHIRLRVILMLLVWSGQVAALRASEPTPLRAADPWLPALTIQKYQLSNGLTVVLHEDHNTPLVAVNVVYNVGSKDDPPGRTGFAHVVEHMMFEGSEHSDWSFFGPIYPYSAWVQGTTYEDRTVYQTTVTRNALELVLWLEADRMGFLLPAVTAEKLANVRNVVKMERRETVDDLPLGNLTESLNRALYPPGHPYQHPQIGSFADVSVASLADVSAFFQKYYGPSNAFLCIAGDFSSSLARRWIKKYFGALPPGEPVTPTRPEETSEMPSRQIHLTDPIARPETYLVWKTVPAYHPDEAALDVLASVLGGISRGGRFYRTLVQDQQLAIQVSASHPTHQLAGKFEVCLVARKGVELDKLVRLADAEIKRIKQEGPTAVELWRAKIDRRTSQIRQLDSLTSKAWVLNHSASTRGDPLAYRDVLLQVFAVSSADVMRAARKYLGTSRVELDVLPGERVLRAYESQPVSARVDPQAHLRPEPHREGFDRSLSPNIGRTPRFVPPAIVRRKLSSGLEVRIVERHDQHGVIVKLVLKSGETSTPPGKEGLCSIALDLLDEGTRSRSGMEVEDDQRDTGATLITEGSLESSTVTLTTPTRCLRQSLDLFSDVILNPVFPDPELTLIKRGRLILLENHSQTPEQISEDVFPRLVYHSNHPYARAKLGRAETVRSITRQDVVAFYRRHFVPGNATLVVVGDVRPDAIVSELETRFGKWPTGPLPVPPDLRVVATPGDSQTVYLIDLPGSLQSVVTVGRISTSARGSARYGLEILRKKLTGRIETVLRDERGCSYGFTSKLPRRKGPAPLTITGSVHQLDTGEAVREILQKMADLSGPAPVTQEDVSEILGGMIPTWFDRFETITDVAKEVADLISLDLPDSHWTMEAARYAALSEYEIAQTASRHLVPEGMRILVVGDRAWIESLLRTLPSVKQIILLDPRGNPLPVPPG